MDAPSITRFIARPDKSLLGVCSAIAQKIKLPALGVRLGFVALTLLFIPLGILGYLGAHMAFNLKKGRMLAFGLLGALLGLPMSYYFQSDLVQNFGGSSGMSSYLGNFTDTVEAYDSLLGNGWDIVLNVFLSILVFALVGGALGYLMDKNEMGKDRPK